MVAKWIGSGKNVSVLVKEEHHTKQKLEEAGKVGWLKPVFPQFYSNKRKKYAVKSLHFFYGICSNGQFQRKTEFFFSIL